MPLKLSGHRGMALLIAATAGAGVHVFAQTAATPAPAASAAAAGEAAPSERARRDAEKVFHWILIQGDRTRKTTASPTLSKDTKEAKDDRPPAAPGNKTAARGTPAPRAAPGEPLPEAVPRQTPGAVAAASAPATSGRTAGQAGRAPGTPPATGAALALQRTGESDAPSTRPDSAAPAAAPAIAPPAEAPVALVPIAQPEPQFPVAAMRTLRKGSVQVRFSVQADGSVADLEVLQSSNPRLNAAALGAIGQWRFQPIARPQTAAVEVGFNLD